MHLDLTWIIVAVLLAVLANQLHKIILGVRAYRSKRRQKMARIA